MIEAVVRLLPTFSAIPFRTKMIHIRTDCWRGELHRPVSWRGLDVPAYCCQAITRRWLPATRTVDGAHANDARIC